MRSLTAVLLLLLAIGCGRRELNAEEYHAQVSPIWQEWLQSVQEAETSAGQVSRGMSQEERDRIVVADIRKMANIHRTAYERMNEVEPPAKLGSFHEAYENFFFEMADATEKWAAAVPQGRGQFMAAGDEMDRRIREAGLRLANETESIAGDFPQLASFRSQLESFPNPAEGQQR